MSPPGPNTPKCRRLSIPVPVSSSLITQMQVWLSQLERQQAFLPTAMLNGSHGPWQRRISFSSSEHIDLRYHFNWATAGPRRRPWKHGLLTLPSSYRSAHMTCNPVACLSISERLPPANGSLPCEKAWPGRPQDVVARARGSISHRCRAPLVSSQSVHMDIPMIDNERHDVAN